MGRSIAMRSRPISTKCWCPSSSPGALSSWTTSRATRARKAIETAGATLLYLPPYSPDLTPIENAFTNLKALLRKAAARSIDSLWTAIGRVIDLFTSNECVNYFKAAGYGLN